MFQQFWKTAPPMVSNTIESDGRPQRRPLQSSSDGRGGEVAETLDMSGPRYIYYRLYTTEGPIRSNNPIYANNPFISRTLPKFITPPRTASSVKKHICKIEGLSGAESSRLFESLSSQSAAAESFKLAVKEDSGLGLSKDDPIVLVVGVEDVKNRKASATQLVGLPEALPSEPRYVHYYLYDEDGEMTSKTAFDMDDSSLGRIDTLAIAPPQTLASLRSQVMKAEGLVNQNIQLFEDMDGDVPMNDTASHISFQTQVYPGHEADQPITIVCSQQRRGEVQEAQNTNQMDPSFSNQIRAPKVGRRLSARVADLFKAKGKTELATPAKIEEHPPMIEEPEPVAPLAAAAEEPVAFWEAPAVEEPVAAAA